MAEYVKEHGATLDALKQVADKLNAQIAKDEQSLTGYLKSDEAEKTYAKISDVEKKADASQLANYVETATAEDTYAKKTDIASAYIAKGSVDDLAGLAELNIEGNVGYVYNVKAAFSTDETFVEGSGKSYPAGTNVVVVEDQGEYKFDALAGITDLSAYETAAQAAGKYATQSALTEGLAEKANTSDLEGYVDSGELTTALAGYAKSKDVSDTYETKANVTSGLAGKADKTELEDYLDKETAGTTYVAKTEIATEEEITALINELFPTE